MSIVSRTDACLFWRDWSLSIRQVSRLLCISFMDSQADHIKEKVLQSLAGMKQWDVWVTLWKVENKAKCRSLKLMPLLYLQGGWGVQRLLPVFLYLHFSAVDMLYVRPSSSSFPLKIATAGHLPLSLLCTRAALSPNCCPCDAVLSNPVHPDHSQ